MHLLLEIDNLLLGDAEFEKKLSQMMEWFMAITTREYHSAERKHNLIPGNVSLWKSDFSHHILKTAKEIMDARKYINENPRNWSVDTENREIKTSDNSFGAGMAEKDTGTGNFLL
jgi:hypothetical protein